MANIQKSLLLEADLIKAIDKKLGSTNYKLLYFDLEPLSERTGLLGDHAMVSATISKNNLNQEEHLDFFVKFFPQLKAPAEFAEGIGAFTKEMFMYDLFEKFENEEIKIISDCVPKCYLKQHNQYFIFDNLILDNFQQLNKRELLDYNSIIVILKSLAKFHCSSLIYEEKKSTNDIPYRLIDEYKENLEETFFNDDEDFANRQGIEASFKCILKEIEIFDFPNILASGKEFKEVADECCYNIYKLVKPSMKFRNVLCHGDLWATNFLIKYDGKGFAKHCKFVDFQCGRYAPPAQDVLSLIYLTTSRDFRKKHMYELIGIYYSFMEKILKVAGFDLQNLLKFDEFMASCEEYKLFAIIQTAVYFPLILMGNDVIEKYFSDEDVNRQALFEDRSILVLNHKDDEFYASRLKESLQDLKEFCDYK